MEQEQHKTHGFMCTCNQCETSRLQSEIDRLTADFKKAQERIHELTTYGDRENSKIIQLEDFLSIERKALELACYELWKLDPMDAPKEWSEPDYFRKQAQEK